MRGLLAAPAWLRLRLRLWLCVWLCVVGAASVSGTADGGGSGAAAAAFDADGAEVAGGCAADGADRGGGGSSGADSGTGDAQWFNSASAVLSGLDALQPVASENNEKEANSARRIPVRRHRVAVGYNSNLDLILRATSLLEHFPIAADEGHGDTIDAAVSSSSEQRREILHDLLNAPLASRAHLQRVFAHFFAHGAAAERVVSNATLFGEIVTVAQQLAAAGLETQTVLDGGGEASNANSAHYFTGGNAALMARRFAVEEQYCEAVLLGGHVGTQLRGMLPASIEVTTVPGTIAEMDEVHLILEYAKGEVWRIPTAIDSNNANDNGSRANSDMPADAAGVNAPAGRSPRVVAPRANRFIVVRDETNSMVKGLEPFHDALEAFSPTVVVVAGLHLLDDQPSAFRLERLLAVAHRLDPSGEAHDGHYHLPGTVPVHLELASIANPEYMQELAALLVPRVNSLGLNEQELGALYAALLALGDEADDSAGGPSLRSQDFKDPSIETVLHALQFIFRKTKQSTNTGTSVLRARELQRIHFHCLHFHVVLVADGAAPAVWSRRHAGALAAGSTAASRQACDKIELTDDDVEILVNQTFVVPAGYEIVAGSKKHASAERSGESVAEFQTERPVVELHDSHAGFGAWVAPVCVCRVPLKTVGLGDAISAVALLRHL